MDRSTSWASFLLAVVLVMSACGGTSEPESTATADAADAAEQAAATSEGVATEVEAEPSPTEEPPAEPTPAPTAEPTAEPTPEPVARPMSVDEILALDEPLNIAHAGGDLEAPHSTLFAFAEAVEAGAHILEFDVLTTKDGVVVVQHDETVDKTTNETGPVKDLTLAAFEQLDNAYWFSAQCWPCQDRPVAEYLYRGVRTGDVPAPDGYDAEDFSVTTLAELDERFPSLPFNIEIKGEGDYGLEVAAALAAELTALDRLDSTVVVSFSDDVIDAFHAAAPTVEVSPGTNRLTTWFLTQTPLDPMFRIVQVPPFSSGIEVATAETIERAHAEGLEVWVWPDDAGTQENTGFYQELLDRGVDGIIAGRPAVLAETLE